MTYKNGHLYFSTATPGAQVITEIKCTDVKTYQNVLDISLSASYDIKAYATKSGYGYLDSDRAWATLVWAIPEDYPD